MTTMTISDQDSGNGFAVDARSIQISAVLFGIGGLICMAGLAVGGYALYDAVSKWIAELETPPGAMAANTWSRGKASAAAGIRAWLEQQEQAQQQACVPQQQKKLRSTTPA